VISPDVVTLIVTAANFDTKNVGTSKTVTATGLSLGGADAGNYALSAVTATDLAKIDPAELTVTADGKSKFYDGEAFTAFTASFSGFVADETFATSGVTGSPGFTVSPSPAVNARTYTITPVVGTLEATNYTFRFVNGSLTIKQVPLTVTAVNREKVWDGLAYPFNTDPITTTDVTYSGFVNNEGPSVLTGALTFTAAGQTAVGTYTNTPGGLGATNYATEYVAGTLKILAWTLTGFYQPVDMSTGGLVWNTVKAGSTVPLKFNVYQATTADPTKERTDVGTIESFKVASVACNNSTYDLIEFTTTGGTSLRYDTTARQFVQNWQTPKSPGTCLQVTMTTLDGSKLQAYFSLK
jgi:hypothetical protein